MPHVLIPRLIAAGALIMACATGATASEGKWYSGDWYLTVGASLFVAPDFRGASDYLLGASPLVSFGRAGPQARFRSRNDNISFSLIDRGAFRAGVTGKVVFARDEGDSDDLQGLDDVRWGAEIGGFAEVYPTDWLRVRAELRQGLRSYKAVVGDLTADAFTDVTPTIRISGGPRLRFASSDYFDAYYGVDSSESKRSGLSTFSPSGGFEAVGVGGAVNWKTTEKIATSVFAEYARLVGSASDSSLVEERGSANQLQIGVTATYRFDFTF